MIRRILLLILISTTFVKFTDAQYLLSKNTYSSNSQLSIKGRPLLSLYKEPKKKDPTTATILSAIIPGAGQIYNGKIWKVPIIYAGLGGFGYGMYWNRNEMKKFQDELDGRLLRNDTTNFLNLSVAQLKSNRDFYRSNRDLSMVGFFVIYVLNIVDATVDAHLSEFRIDDNISMGIEPRLIDNRNLGIGLTLRF